MSEFDPDAHVILSMEDGTERRLDRYNSALFTFVGKTAVGEDRSARNHIYMRFEDGEQVFGTYIFANSEVFKQLAGYMLQHDFPAHLNMNEVSETDEDAYRQMIEKEVQSAQGELGSDFMPDGWE